MYILKYHISCHSETAGISYFRKKFKNNVRRIDHFVKLRVQFNHMTKINHFDWFRYLQIFEKYSRKSHTECQITDLVLQCS